MSLKTMLCFLTMVLTATAAQAITIKNISYVTKNAGTVVFDHSFHLKQSGINNNCKACHDAVFNMKQRTHSTMAEMEKGKSCGACHDGNKAFHLKECVRCHQVKEVTIAVKGAGKVPFSHKSHTSRNVCSDCHTKVFSLRKDKVPVSMTEMEKGKSCGTCHDGKKAFTVAANCAECHKL